VAVLGAAMGIGRQQHGMATVYRDDIATAEETRVTGDQLWEQSGLALVPRGPGASPDRGGLREGVCGKRQSGAKAGRQEFDKCLAYLREGDVLVAVKLDRFGRSTKHLIQVAEDLEARGVGLRCLDQPIDTTTPLKELVFTILAAIGEFERALIFERTADGLVSGWGLSQRQHG
jgi:Resolvase, N terminal domain